MTLKSGSLHQGNRPIIVCSNDDLGLNYFTDRSNWVYDALNGEKLESH